MASFKIFFVLLFILKLKTVMVTPDVSSYIRSKYNEEGFRRHQKFLNAHRKAAKLKLDVFYLLKCKIYNVTPKFLRFKLYREDLQNRGSYKYFRNKLLCSEISSKETTLLKQHAQLLEVSEEIHRNFTWLDRKLLTAYCTRTVSEYISKTEVIHNKKLFDFGIRNKLAPCDPMKVVPSLEIF